MHGLKFKILCLLLLVQLVGMLLLDVIITTIWQHDTITKTQAVHTEQLTLLKQLSPTHELVTALVRLSREQVNYFLKTPEKLMLFGTPSPAYLTQMKKMLQQAADSQQPQSQLVETGWGVFFRAKQYLFLAVPLHNDPHRSTGAIGLIAPLAPVYHHIWQQQKAIWCYLIINIIILTVITLLRLLKWTVQPLDKLVQLTDAFTQQDKTPFFAARERNEFGQLSQALNRMLKRIDDDKIALKATIQSLKEANQQLLTAQQEMVQTEKLAAVGRLAAGLAHEIGNPISIIQGYLDLLQQQNFPPETQQDLLARADLELKRIDTLIRQLLSLGRPVPPQYSTVLLDTLLEDLVSLLHTSQPQCRPIELTTRLQLDHQSLESDAEQLRQVFLNCLLNSLDSLYEKFGDQAGGTLLIQSESVPKPTPHYRITIRDNGVGIPPEALKQIFEPFYTSKRPGEGTGLGLFVSYNIIQALGGQLHLNSPVQQGAEAIIELPLQVNHHNG